jgi:hypothetical protein
LRTLSLCTCCRHYPGAVSGRTVSLIHPAVSAFPERVVGSACALSFSRLARRSLTLRPAHSRCHQFVTRYPKASASSLPPWLLRLLPAGAFAGWALHPLESAALSRRTPFAEVRLRVLDHDISRRHIALSRPSAIERSARRVVFGGLSVEQGRARHGVQARLGRTRKNLAPSRRPNQLQYEIRLAQVSVLPWAACAVGAQR